MNKYKDIKDFMAIKLKHIKINSKLTKRIRQFRYEWSAKSDDYLDFLGSNLLGVHYIRFSELDNIKLMNDTLHIEDYSILQKEIFDVPDMKKKYKVASNIIYQVLMYLAYRYLKSKDLSKDERENGIRELFLLMEYKMFTSLYSRYFIYQTPEPIAVTVYNRLSHKYLIKNLENWQELFEYRVNILLEKNSVNNKQLSNYNTLNSIALISAIQTKLRGNVKEIYVELIDVIENDDIMKIESSTYVGGEAGVEQGKEVTIGNHIYINRIKQIAQQKHDFIDNETIKIVSTLFNNVDEDLIKKFLICMTNDKFIQHDELQKIIETSMLISFAYLQRMNVNVENKETIPKALINIRFYWASSKVKNEEMNTIKGRLAVKAKECINRKTNWLLTTLALSYVIYIYLRSMKK